jgi:hypothetical protein
MNQLKIHGLLKKYLVLAIGVGAAHLYNFTYCKTVYTTSG